MRRGSYLTALALLTACASNAPPTASNPSQSEANQAVVPVQTPTEPQVPRTLEQVLVQLQQMPKNDLAALFDIDVYRGFHASIGPNGLSLTQVQDPFVVEYNRYADELLAGNIEHATQVTNELHRMKRGRTYVGTWDGVRYYLSDADQRRPFERVEREIRDLSREHSSYDQNKRQNQRHLAQLQELQTRCDPSLLEDMETQIRSVQFQIAEPFTYSDQGNLLEQMTFFKKELVERNFDFPRARDAQVLVVVEPYGSRQRRTDVRARLGAGPGSLIILEDPIDRGFVFRAYHSGRYLGQTERDE